jgi:hypothetical protein
MIFNKYQEIIYKVYEGFGIWGHKFIAGQCKSILYIKLYIYQL